MEWNITDLIVFIIYYHRMVLHSILSDYNRKINPSISWDGGVEMVLRGSSTSKTCC
jgi:hypothetical protein